MQSEHLVQRDKLNAKKVISKEVKTDEKSKEKEKKEGAVEMKERHRQEWRDLYAEFKRREEELRTTHRQENAIRRAGG